MNEEPSVLSPRGLSFRAQSVLRDHLGDRALTREVVADLRTIDLLAVPTCGRSTVDEIARWMRDHGLEIDRPVADAGLLEAVQGAIRRAALPKLSMLQRDRLTREIVRLVRTESRR